MKKITCSIILIFTALLTNGQNLVPNPSFETYTNCPTATSQMYLAAPWTTPSTNVFGVSGTPDFFHQCSSAGSTGVPSNYWGYQFAHTGDGYAHCVLYEGPLNAKEYIEVELTSPLTAGVCYYFEMYVSIPDICNFSTDAMGVYFSNTLISGVPNWYPLPYTPQINNAAGNFPDTASWTLVSGNYTALGGESYIIIGNFKDDVNTPLMTINSTGQNWAYAYFDDVSLSPCTGINNPAAGNREITLYPNPVKDELFVNCNLLKGKSEIVITDIFGKEIYKTKLRSSNIKLQTSNYLPGIYFLEINDGKNVWRKKFLKVD